VGELLQTTYVALDDERLRPGLEALAQAGLLEADRIAAILDYNPTSEVI